MATVSGLLLVTLGGYSSVHCQHRQGYSTRTHAARPEWHGYGAGMHRLTLCGKKWLQTETEIDHGKAEPLGAAIPGCAGCARQVDQMRRAEAARAAEWASNDADLDNEADLARWQTRREMGVC